MSGLTYPTTALLKQARKAQTPTEVNGQLVFRVFEVLATTRLRFRCPICPTGILINERCPVCSLDFSTYSTEERERICVAHRQYGHIDAYLRHDPRGTINFIEKLKADARTPLVVCPELTVLERPYQTEHLRKLIGGAK